MLKRLAVSNVVLIDTLELYFGPGLTILTGETGAGKSILLDAIALVVGARGDTGRIRHNADVAEVEATFSPPTPASPEWAHLDALDLLEEGEDLVLRRTLRRDGRSKSWINARQVTVGQLRQVGECLLEVQGQFEQHGLRQPSQQLALLDSFAGVDRAALSGYYHRWAEASEALQALTSEQAMQEREQSFLIFQRDELRALSPCAEDYHALVSSRQRLRHQEMVTRSSMEIAEAASAIHREIANLYRGIERVTSALGDTEQTPLHLQFEKIRQATERAEIELAEIETVSAQLDTDAASIGSLEDVESRLYTYREVARKQQVAPEALSERLAEIETKLNRFANFDAELETLTHTERQHWQALHALVAETSAQRKQVLSALEQAVMAELQFLRLEACTFAIALEPKPESDFGETGGESAVFHVATNPGQSLAPLAKVGSGGELARLMLALKIAQVSGRGGNLSEPLRQTLIFDEVETGIGGETATQVGIRLARLARSSAEAQVLVVTHAPQIAAFADQQFVIRKQTIDNQTMTTCEPLVASAIPEELARMLSGSTITTQALSAAKQLRQESLDQIAALATVQRDDAPTNQPVR